jgi:hypothetical protein
MIRAHEKWLAAGMPKGNGRSFWIEAERELRAQAQQEESRLCSPGWRQ